MESLQNKKILLCVTGGIAAYKACDVLRRLQDAGAEVRVAMTPSATEFVTPMTFAALSGHAVFFQKEPQSQSASAFQHIDLPRWAEDLLIVAPASANSIARFANGLADEPVSQCVLATLAPKVIVPAMNFAMWQAPATQRNLQTLKNDGFTVVDPEAGRLACGEIGQGRFPATADILEACKNALISTQTKQVLSTNKTVLITLGRTEESIDPVRFITNKSSGKTGVAIANCFLENGWNVILIKGPMETPIPFTSPRCKVVAVTSAQEMHDATLAHQNACDAMIFCAAVADYKPKISAQEKIKDSRSHLILELEANPNILCNAVANRNTNPNLKDQIIVGFALETHDALRHGQEKLSKSGADFLVLNTPVKSDSGFGKNQVEYCILQQNNSTQESKLALGEKSKLAQELFDSITHQFKVI